jgi:hypothetical protein
MKITMEQFLKLDNLEKVKALKLVIRSALKIVSK